MKLVRLVFFPALIASLGLAAPNKEIVELNRTVSDLQEQIRQLQRTVDERLAALGTLVQQSIESANKGNASISVLEKGVRERMAEQQKNLVPPVMASVRRWIR
jgi:hypothetical protein